MPRIITGSARGTRLIVPSGDAVRPTPDRAKEALFSILGKRVIGARVLDVFAGSGQIALEALSRGAEKAVLIEREREALAAIRQNIEKTHFVRKAEVMPGDARRVLQRLLNRGGCFDIIYADPPWRLESRLLSGLFPVLCDLVSDGGQIILESSAESPLETFSCEGVSLSGSCNYGLSVLSFYQRSSGTKQEAPQGE